MTRVPARLFGPALHDAGVDAVLSVDATTLSCAVAGEPPRRAALAEASVAVAGFDRRGLAISWHADGTAWTAQVLDADSARELLAAWPASGAAAVRGLARQRAHQRRGQFVAFAALAAIVAVPLLLLALFLWQQARIVDAIAAHIDAASESRIGAAAFERSGLQQRTLDRGPAARAVRELGARLVPERSPYSYRFHLVDDDAVNAFALPGGTVVVNRGLLAATRRPEELAGVLAHEIQHVELRHSLKAMIRGAGLTLLWAWVAGDPGATLAGQAADRLLSLKFSRDAEREADQRGFAMLAARGIDPGGMVEFFKTLAADGAGAPPPLLSTHPASAEREAALGARLRQLPAGCCPPLAWPGAWPPRS